MIAVGCWLELLLDKILLVITIKGQVGWRLVKYNYLLKKNFHKRFSMRFYILMMKKIVDFLGPLMRGFLIPSQAIKW